MRPYLLPLLLLLAGASSDRGVQHARPAALFLSTPADERSAAVSPDGRTIVFALRIADYRQALVVVERRGRGWGEPRVAPFSGERFDADPSFSPDGRMLYFVSDRDAAGREQPDLDIWQVPRTAGGWGTPAPVTGVNSRAQETSPVLTRAGRLYFASSREGGSDLYVAEPLAAGFAAPRRLGPAVNSEAAEYALAVSPDESWLVFASVGRPDQPIAPGVPYPRGDLYVSRRGAGGWEPAVRLGPSVNTLATEGAPAFSADGRTLYFMSEYGFATDWRTRLSPAALRRGMARARNGLGNIYVIDFASARRSR